MASAPRPPATRRTTPSLRRRGPPRPTQPARRWAALLKRVWHVDPLRCPTCGAAMKIVSFIEPTRPDLIQKILTYCGLADEPPRAPPRGRHSGRTAPADHPEPIAQNQSSYQCEVFTGSAATFVLDRVQTDVRCGASGAWRLGHRARGIVGTGARTSLESIRDRWPVVERAGAVVDSTARRAFAWHRKETNHGDRAIV